MLKVAIVGPESSGKSELSKALAKVYKSSWIPEYAREYLENLGRQYAVEDLDIMAKKELELIKNCDKSAQFCFIDTELISLKVWSEFKYKKPCSSYISSKIPEQEIGFYILCFPDIPWEYDPLRENPNDRQELFEIFERELNHYQLPYLIVRGKPEERLATCRVVLDKILKKP